MTSIASCHRCGTTSRSALFKAIELDPRRPLSCASAARRRAPAKSPFFATTHKVSGQPCKPCGQGLDQARHLQVPRSGAFITSYLHPKRTTYYVVRYDGYAFEAFTSVVKVTVR